MSESTFKFNELKDVINNDIIIQKNIDDEINNSIVKNWIKKIDFNKAISFEKYNNKKDFIKVADIIADNDICEKDTKIKKKGEKQRNTLIKYVPTIDSSKFEQETLEWMYIFTIDRHIVKIGGTRTGLKSRFNSYLCGHQVKERGKNGSCSNTNAYIYNTFDFYINNGYNIEMYAYEIPSTKIKIPILGEEVEVLAQVYHAYESCYINNYKKIYLSYPPLNDNCDPNYKN